MHDYVPALLVSAEYITEGWNWDVNCNNLALIL